MGSVAKWRIAGILAAAQQRRFRAFCSEHEGFDACARMRAVAKGLILAAPTGAPCVTFALFKLNLIGVELRAFGLVGHLIIPALSSNQ
jgi:hypothetical protein